MKTKLLILFLILGLSGCVTTTPNFAVKRQFWDNKNKVIGVVVGDMPSPSAHKGGNQGLLDIVINNSNADDLELHLNTLDVSRISDIAIKMTRYLKGKGLKVKHISKNLDLKSLNDFEAENNESSQTYYSNLDYRLLKTKYGVDKLVVINIVRIGTIRNYYGFVPLGDPSGLSHLGGYVVNLDNNQLEWKQSVVQQSPNNTDDWDSPPKFDGLTKAMYVAFDQSKNMLFNHFAK